MEKTEEEIMAMLPKIKETRCGCCSNHCPLKINIFSDGRRLISGNHCGKPIAGSKTGETYEYDIFEYKRALLDRYINGKHRRTKRGSIGLPMSLSMYEFLPFFHTVFSSLGFDVVVSPCTTAEMYEEGRELVPSDTVDMSARLLHAHVKYLLEAGVDRIFIPSISSVQKKEVVFQMDPTVAYYGSTVKLHLDDSAVPVITSLLPFEKAKMMARRLSDIFDISKGDVKEAVENGLEELKTYRKKLSKVGSSIVKKAKKDGRKVVLVSTRAQYMDPVLFKDLDKMLLSLGYSVVSDDSVSKLVPTTLDNHFDQWYGHGRMHDAARVAAATDMKLVLLKTSTCPLDAVVAVDIRAVMSKKPGNLVEIEIGTEKKLSEMFEKLLSLNN